MFKQQRGAISGAIVALIVIVGLIGAVVLIGVGSYVSAYNYGNRMEKDLQAVQDDNKNILAQYGQKVLEAVQVPDKYKNDLVEVTKAAIQGRYGANGSQAAFQVLTEKNPELNAQLYQQVQQIVESGRDNFEQGQKRQIDIRRQYETQLGTLWAGMWLRMAGYPKVNLKDFDIVSTDRADTAFKNHKEDGPIKLQ